MSEEDVKKILLSLDTSKAAGMDQIPAKFLRDGAEVLALPLGNIINLSIKLSTFPEECKIAKLKPIFKKGARTDPKNYRPISLLPLVSKIIEKSIHFQIEDYLNKKKLICMDKQIYIYIYIYIYTSMILDLQKAFDTLDHGVLLEKMKYFGFRTSVIKWFESYLPYRKFSIYIDNVFFWGLNIKVRCTTRLYPWTAPFSVICKWSTPVIIRRRLLFVCRWHLYFLPTWGPYKNWKCFK